jgi:hypothetical protein
MEKSLHTRPGHPGCPSHHDETDAREDQCVQGSGGQATGGLRGGQRFERGIRLHLTGHEGPEPLERGLWCALAQRRQRVLGVWQVILDLRQGDVRRDPDRACKCAHIRSSVDAGGQVLEAPFIDSGSHNRVQSRRRADVRQVDAFLHTSTVKFEPIGHGEPPHLAIGTLDRDD